MCLELPLLLAAILALAACSDSFTDACTQPALSANPPNREKQMNESLQRTG